MDDEKLPLKAVRDLLRYCVVCEREYGAHLERHCTRDSLIAVKTVGFFRKEKRYFSLNGTPLNEQALAEMKAREKESYAQEIARRMK